MPSPLSTLFQSLRFRLVLGSSVVLVAMLLVAVINNVHLFERAMTAQEDGHLAQLHGLFKATLVGPLARRDEAALKTLLNELRRDSGIEYLVLQDANDRVLAASGWDLTQSLPARHASFAHLPAGARRFDGSAPLLDGDRVIGRVSYGISTAYMRDARDNLILQSTIIGWLAFIVSVMILAAIGRWLTRDLRRLQRGVAALQRGESSVQLAVFGAGEIADLTRAFNQMAQALDERVEALKKSEARFHAIADYTFGAEGWFDPQGRLIWVNRSIERVTGYTAAECLEARNIIELLVYEKDRPYAREQSTVAIKGTQGRNFEIRLKRKDAAVIWASFNWQAIYSAGGSFQGLRVSVDDIQARKEAELCLLDTVAELRRAQGLKDSYLRRSNDERARLAALLNVMRIGVLFIDAGNRVIYCNNAFNRVWGIPESETLIGVRISVLLDRTRGLRADNGAFKRHLVRVRREMETTAPFEINLTDGRILSEISTMVHSSDGNRDAVRLLTYEDVTELRRTAEQLIQLATRDPLTELYNRRRFHEEIGRMLADAARRKVQAGLLAFDLDGFKPINDEFGHQAGDQVLVTLAREVRSVIRRNEILFRVGGDEFAVLVLDTAEDDMIGLARRVGERIEALRFQFNGTSVGLTASLGVALFPVHATSDAELVAHADHAMYRAKSAGRNRWQVYQPECEPHLGAARPEI